MYHYARSFQLYTAVSGKEGTIRVVARGIPEDTLDPSDDFVRGWVAGLVEIYDTGLEIGLDISLERGTSVGNGSEMSSSDL